MVVVKRELSNMESILRDFKDKNEEDGKPLFIKTFGFYLDGLKFDFDTVMKGLDEEIAAGKREMEEMERMNLEKIKSLVERVRISE